MSVPNPFEQLGLSLDATPEQVRARYLELSKIHHPDAGGSAEAFTQLEATYNEALTRARAPKPCSTCKGKGREEVKNGFSRSTLVCSVCRGTGRKPMNTGPLAT